MRGALIVVEGCDRAGKSTQCKLLVERLQVLNYQARGLSFPDRSTYTGKLIDEYLKNKIELPDQTIHLLFTANRWELEPKIRAMLSQGISLVIDRYSYSGIAYSSAKEGMDLEWCKLMETGLPKPDAVFFLHLEPSQSAARQGFGQERYEQHEFQKAVSSAYSKLKDDTWQIVNADVSLNALSDSLIEMASSVIEKVKDKDLDVLW